jgi:hypothetical protein
MTVFIEIEKVDDHSLLSPLQAVLDDTEEAESLVNWKQKWEVIETDKEKTESPQERTTRLISFLHWIVKSKQLLRVENADKIEEVFHVLFFFLDDLKESDDEKEVLFFEMANLLCSSASYPEKQLEMCSTLLNMIPRCDEVPSSRRDHAAQQAHNKRWGNCRGRVFSVMLEFAKEYKQGGLFRGLLSKELFTSWFVEEDLYINLIEASYQLLKQTQDASEEAHKFLIELVHKKKDQGQACSAVVNVLSSKKNSPRDLMEVYSLAAVRNLKNDARLRPLYNLLHILYEGDVAAYKEFLENPENAQSVEDLSLDQNNIMFKIQQLTLCDLGRQQPLQKLDELQEKLSCKSLFELERVVQAAQQQGLLEALFDFSNHTLRLHKVALRVFRNSPECWNGLSKKLDTWAMQTQTILNYALPA